MNDGSAQQQQQAQPLNATFVSERGVWQRKVMNLLLAGLLATGIWNIVETNENETRSRDGRPLLCGLAYDDALENEDVAAVYIGADCAEEFSPLPGR